MVAVGIFAVIYYFLSVFGVSARGEKLIQRAIETNDYSLCKDVSGWDGSPNPQSCYHRVARTNDNLEACNQSLNPGQCYSLVANKQTTVEGSVNICVRGTTVGGRDECYRSVAYARKDKTICNKIENEAAKDSCLTSYKFKE